MTKAQRHWLSRVADLGCCICNGPAEIHHVMRAGKRSPHIGGTIPLCPTHHRLGNIGVAVHSGRKTWEDIHGTQRSLLLRVNAQLSADQFP